MPNILLTFSTGSTAWDRADARSLLPLMPEQLRKTSLNVTRATADALARQATELSKLLAGPRGSSWQTHVSIKELLEALAAGTLTLAAPAEHATPPAKKHATRSRSMPAKKRSAKSRRRNPAHPAARAKRPSAGRSGGGA